MTTKAGYFPAGSRLLIRDEEWLVTRCDAVADGGYALHVTGLSGIVRDHEAIFLRDLEDRIEELRPEAATFEWDTSPKHRRSRLYIEALLRATPPTDSKIYLGHRGVLNQARYQLEPARLALESLRPRILIADGVGLGKTLEVGILLAELIRRGRGQRILVVALKSILLQFQQELWSRFAIPLVRLDSQGIERMRRRIPASRNPFTVVDKAIISIDTLKDDGRYRHFLENCRFDAVVIDECHNVANLGSDRGRLAALLAERADALIMTSATPHNGRPASFANLVNMLEPTAIANPDDYTADDIRGLYVRRFKKDIRAEVAEEFTERELDIEYVDASPPEEAVYDALADLRFHALDRKNTGNPLFRTTLVKSWLSSPEACRETIAERLKTLAKPDWAEREGVDLDATCLASLDRVAAGATAAPTAKITRLLNLMSSEMGYGSGRGTSKNKQADRLIVFSERIATLGAVKAAIVERFGLTEDQVAIFTSDGLSDVEQQRIIDDFGKEDSPLRVLLATDVASEGVNLHYYCHRMVHFDVPWSPIVLEQRNGRIDRFGQKQTPWIRYLVTRTKNTRIAGDLRILEVLVEKEKHAHQNLGDAALLLGLHDPEAEANRVAKAIEKQEQFDALFTPPKGEQDLLELLLAGRAPPSSSDPTGSFPSFFRDDFEFVRTALDDVGPRLGEIGLEVLPDTQSIKLNAPPELESLRMRLPDEAWPDEGRFHLTADRDLVAQKIAEARRKKDEWPAAQLLSELHPLFRWLVDKVLVGVPRNTAPVLAASEVAPGEVYWLFMGSFGNRRGQTWLAEWFGVHAPARGKPSVIDFPAFLEATGLRTSANRQRNAETSIPAAVTRTRDPALALAREHLSDLFIAQKREVESRRQEFFRRLDSWQSGATRLVQEEKAALRANGITRGPRYEAADQKARQIEDRLQSRKDWAEQILDPASNVPFVRIAAAVVAPPEGGE